MKKNTVALLLIITLVIVPFTGCGGADSEVGGVAGSEPITLRLSSDAPTVHMATEINNWLADEVAKRTEGRVNIQVFPASALGGYDTVFNEIMMGTIDMGQIPVNAQVDPRLNIVNLPYACSGYESAGWIYRPDSFLCNYIGDVFNDLGMDFLGYMLEGFMGIGMTKPMTDPLTPGTPKQVLIRCWATPVSFETAQDWGFNTVTIAYAEVPTAIQTGVVDGWLGGTANANYAYVGDFLTEYYRNFSYAENTSFMISHKTVAKLDPADYEILKEVVQEASAMSIERAEANEEYYLEKLRENGVETITFTDEQVLEWTEFTKTNTWPKLENEMPKDAMDGIAADYEEWLKTQQ